MQQEGGEFVGNSTLRFGEAADVAFCLRAGVPGQFGGANRFNCFGQRHDGIVFEGERAVAGLPLHGEPEPGDTFLSDLDGIEALPVLVNGETTDFVNDVFGIVAEQIGPLIDKPF